MISQGANAQAANVTDDQVINYLMSKVPEIKSFGEYLSSNNVKMISYVEGKKAYRAGDSAQYYSVYIGEDHPDHIVRWQTFLVKEDLSDIYVMDFLTGSYKTLKDWEEEYSSVN